MKKFQNETLYGLSVKLCMTPAPLTVYAFKVDKTGNCHVIIIKIYSFVEKICIKTDKIESRLS